MLKKTKCFQITKTVLRPLGVEHEDSRKMSNSTKHIEEAYLRLFNDIKHI